MKDGKTRFGIWGCGTAAAFHANAVDALPGAALVGAFDSLDSNARGFCLPRGIRQFSSSDELLSCPEVDAVCICTPSGLHAAQALDAIRHGKDVLIEKPLAISSRDAERIFDARRESGRTVGVVSQLRCYPDVQRVKHAIDEGRLGKITLVRLDMIYYRSQEYYDSSPWRGTLEMDGGGALMNQGIHGIDLLLCLMGPVRTVFSYARTLARDIEAEDTACAVLEFENGALGSVTAATSVLPGSPRRLQICGTRGTVALTENLLTEWNVEGEDAGDYVSRTPDYVSFNAPEAVPLSAHLEVLRDFCGARESRRPPISGAADGFNATSLIEAFYAASRTDLPQKPKYINPDAP